jgi:hypothetical protein
VASNICDALPRGNVFNVFEHENAVVASGRRVIDNKHSNRYGSTTYLQDRHAYISTYSAVNLCTTYIGGRAGT